MMQVDYELMQPLVEARQEHLRNEATTRLIGPGRLRTLVGLRLVRLGEQIGGTQRTQRTRPAPVFPARLAVR